MAGKILTQNCWVLIADGEKALILENHGDAQDPHLQVIAKDTQDNPSDREQSANRPGRMNDSGSGQRSAFQDTDWHELAKERFAAELADILYSNAHKGAFEKLVIAASPSVLGDLRGELHKEVSDKVVAEVPKTLTNHTVEEIEKVLKAELD